MFCLETFHKNIINILIIDNDTTTITTILDALCSPLVRVEVAYTLSDAYNKIKHSPIQWHCWIFDLDQDYNNDGFQLMRDFRHYPYLIVLSGKKDMRLAFKAAQLGVLDIFNKSHCFSLPDFIDSVFRIAIVGYLLHGKRSDYLQVFLSLKDNIFTSAPQWADHSCFSLRYLERLCNMYIGLSPRYVLPLYYYLYSSFFLSDPDAAYHHYFCNQHTSKEKAYFKQCNNFVINNLESTYSFLNHQFKNNELCFSL